MEILTHRFDPSKSFIAMSKEVENIFGHAHTTLFWWKFTKTFKHLNLGSQYPGIKPVQLIGS